MNWFQIAPTAGATFLASAVECVEAATIVLAVGTVRGWRSAMTGAGLGLAALAAVVLALGPALARVPERPLQLTVGILLLLFGMRWLRKAVLRGAGIIPLHDEDAVFRSEAANLAPLRVSRRQGIDPVATATAFKAVLLEGLEVAFIVLAVSAGGPGLLPASLAGAVAAAVLVILGAAAVRGPLARVPENTLKFAVGIVISAFGIFWSGEGLGLAWPGQDLSLPMLACGLLATSLLGVRMAAQPARVRRRGVR
jgi:Ca2+/H+ antiporter, TMEM165/GDT1 family